MAASLTSLITSASPVLWSSGEPFDGYVLFTLALPAGRTEAGLEGYPGIRVAERTKVPIKDGVFSSSVRVWQNSEYVPPGNTVNNNMAYQIAWYDATNVLLDAGSLQMVNTDPWVLTPPTLLLP